jgi:hypothetical protein
MSSEPGLQTWHPTPCPPPAATPFELLRPMSKVAVPLLIQVPSVQFRRAVVKTARRPSARALARIREHGIPRRRPRTRRRLRKELRFAANVMVASSFLALAALLLGAGAGAPTSRELGFEAEIARLAPLGGGSCAAPGGDSHDRIGADAAASGAKVACGAARLCLARRCG